MTVPVPCGRCTACCRYELIPLSPHEDPAAYDTEMLPNGTYVLKKKPDGSCVYLGKRGCKIHDRAPEICQVFDCRRFVKRLMAGAYDGRVAPSDSEVVRAGIQRLATLRE